MEGRRSVEGRARRYACPGHRAGTGMSPQPRAHGSEMYGPPKPRRPIASDLRQEPGALAAHAGICAGGSGATRPPTATIKCFHLPSRIWPSMELRLAGRAGGDCRKGRCARESGSRPGSSPYYLRASFSAGVFGRLRAPALHGAAYLDRAAPLFALPKLLALVFMFGPFIELVPGSNRPGGNFCSGLPASAFRFLAFRAAFAFARRRALALVMSSSPF